MAATLAFCSMVTGAFLAIIAFERYRERRRERREERHRLRRQIMSKTP